MIQDTIDGRVLVTGDKQVDFEVQVELAYDDEFDPLAMVMIFKVEDEGEVCWRMARELAMRGSASLTPVGTGDIRFRTDYGLNRVMVCLRVPEGHADIALDRDQFIDFLNRTQAVCKLGEEPVAALIDQELEDLLNE